MVTPEKEEKFEIKHTIEAQQTQKSEEISGQQEHSCLELSQSFFYATGHNAGLCPCSFNSLSETPKPLLGSSWAYRMLEIKTLYFLIQDSS